MTTAPESGHLCVGPTCWTCGEPTEIRELRQHEVLTALYQLTQEHPGADHHRQAHAVMTALRPTLMRWLRIEGQLTELTAERDELLNELDGRDEETRERWIEKQIAETSIRAMEFRNGAHMDLKPARDLVAHWVAAARTLLGDGSNYSETKLEWDVKVAESPEMYTLVVQRHAPGALTPHEARRRAEAERDEARDEARRLRVRAGDVHTARRQAEKERDAALAENTRLRAEIASMTPDPVEYCNFCGRSHTDCRC